jgi:prevent-host-death family protein
MRSGHAKKWGALCIGWKKNRIFPENPAGSYSGLLHQAKRGYPDKAVEPDLAGWARCAEFWSKCTLFEVIMPETEYSVADAKRHFSEILGRVACARERIVISKRGKPVAVLVPPDQALMENRLSKVEGWLEEDDPFFAIMASIVAEQKKHIPRILRSKQRQRNDVSP